MNEEFWRRKKVLITGHTGFKGSWASLWLQSVGAEVIGYALAPPTQPSLFEEAGISEDMTSIIGDVRDVDGVKRLFEEHRPEIVIHMAAQSLVRYSYREPVETFTTNVMGTLNILEGIRSIDTVRAAVMITTDKCYENRELARPFREDEPLGGYDPYSSSKACAELLIASYRNAYFPPEKYSRHHTAVASARAGNVIGGGDWAEDRLIPDMMRSFKNNEPVQVRNPSAIRPWQHVLEPLSGYFELTEKLYDGGADYGEAWNFGPHSKDAKTVQWIIERIVQELGDDARWSIDDGDHPHEANYLKLDCAKARARLSWQPKWRLEEALNKTMDWYKAELAGADMKALCLTQIDEYAAIH